MTANKHYRETRIATLQDTGYRFRDPYDTVEYPLYEGAYPESAVVALPDGRYGYLSNPLATRYVGVYAAAQQVDYGGNPTRRIRRAPTTLAGANAPVAGTPTQLSFIEQIGWFHESA